MDTPAFSDIVTTTLVVVSMLTAFNLVVTAINNFKNLRKPSKDLYDTVMRHETLLSKDKDRLEELENSNKLILKGMLQMVTHEIDGNHTEQLKQIRDDIHSYLIDK